MSDLPLKGNFKSLEERANYENIQLTGGQFEAKRVVLFGADGNQLGGLNLPKWDYVSRGLVSATETWTFKTGGSGGTTVATVVIVYTDTTLEFISSVTRT